MSARRNGWRGIFWGKDFECRIQTESFLVHSVFNRVVNLQADPTKPLLSVVTQLEAMGPNALFVTGGGLEDFKLDFKLDFEFILGSSVIFVSGQLMTGSICIDCMTVLRYSTKLWADSRGDGYAQSSGYGDAQEREHGGTREREYGGARESGYGCVQETGAHKRVQAWLERMSPGLTKVRSPLTEQLTQGLLTEDEGLVRLALAGFIGQGEGLTPAGDDFVAGILLSYIKGFQLYRHESAFLARLPDLVAEVWWRTTTISQTMLWYAARGEGAGYVAEMAEAMHRERGQVLELAARLWAVGASSGRFLLAGVLVGSELFKTREQDKLGRNDNNTIEYLCRFCNVNVLVPKGTKS